MPGSDGPEKDREVILKQLPERYAEKTMDGMVTRADVAVVDEKAFNAISPRVDPAE